MQELDRRERELQMELLDVLTDIATPDNSDVEGEDVEELIMPAARQALLDTRSSPLCGVIPISGLQGKGC